VDARLGWALAALLLCGEVAAILATDRLAAQPVAFAASLSTIAAAILVTAWCVYRRSSKRWSAVLLSPFAIAAATWAVLFVGRPIELYVFPDHASLALGELGFDAAALTHAVALAGLGCAGWCAGYIVALGRSERQANASAPERRVHWGSAVLALAAGTVLWGTLFVHEGGLHALATSAVSVRADQRSSAYGFIGVWMVQGVGLCALTSLLRADGTDRRPLRMILAAAAVLSAAGAVALQVRGLAVFAGLSALAVVLALRPPSTRKVVAGAAAAALLVLGLAFAQQVRAYTARMTTTEAARAAAHTPVWADFASDLGTFDDLVAMSELVPASIPSLHGATLREIPEALVPRGLWPGKPLGVDARAAAYLYPGAAVAVPISLQGELYWNDGLIAILVGSLLVGAAFGMIARVGLRFSAGSGPFLAYATVLPFTHAFLTRGLAVMTENLIFALVGVCVAAMAFGFRPQAAARRRLTLARWSLRAAPGDVDA